MPMGSIRLSHRLSDHVYRTWVSSDALNQPFAVEIVEKSAYVGVEHPVHSLPHDPRVERIQRLVLALASSHLRWSTPGAARLFKLR